MRIHFCKYKRTKNQLLLLRLEKESFVLCMIVKPKPNNKNKKEKKGFLKCRFEIVDLGVGATKATVRTAGGLYGYSKYLNTILSLH